MADDLARKAVTVIKFGIRIHRIPLRDAVFHQLEVPFSWLVLEGISMKSIYCLLIALVFHLSCSGVVWAEKRVALVMGNNAYRNVPALNKAVNDAQAMDRELKALGFEVILKTDASRKDMNRAVGEFLGRLSGGDVAVLFYAGHGVQLGGSNYLLPTDLDAVQEDDVVNDGLELSAILNRIAQTKAKFSLAIIDACRDNPFRKSGRAIGSTRGLTTLSAPNGLMVIYSAGANEQALDELNEKDRDPNGLFTREFLKVMKEPGLRVDEAVRKVRTEVRKKASGVGHQQNPALYDQTDGDFYFRVEGLVKVTPVPPIAPPAQTPGFSLEDLKQQAEAKASWDRWQSGMKAAFDQVVSFSGGADLEAAAWDRFLSAYTQDNPQSDEDERLREESRRRKEAALARAREEAGRRQQVAVVSKPSTTGGMTAGGRDSAIDMEFVRVSGGCFQMGSNDGDGNEKPVHEVCLSPFEIGKYEVTQGQWRAVMGSNPSNFSSCGDGCPVERVSWEDVQDFIKKLNVGGSGRYRLPTEAEWEYACRSGGRNDEMYCGGNDIDRVAWYNGNSGMETYPVGRKSANGLGLYDMSGNVWEWVSDWYENKYYANAPRNNPSGPNSGSSRVFRGGSWDDSPAGVRSARRRRVDPGARFGGLGFRLARTSP
ncbi:MAG: SUMF1/EgtB/PvdO family nonheme iron enzyme [Magnetococcales bacterium]|nr:SUMF1/EgtB/PvdO family nonheme iron enzyme [Magnetococcales bacterium]